MANFSNGRTPVGVWRRRIVFCCFGVVSTTLVLVALFAAALIVSGVLEW
jgi:hypothetical protein